MLRKIIVRSAKLNGVLFLGAASFTAYQYPELAKNPVQLAHAMIRGMRCGHTGARMAMDYLSAKEINSETHKIASQRLYECFRVNAGTYIKLGQMVGQLDQLVPPEYVVSF